MTQIFENPFLEGSEEVPTEEVQTAAIALAEEAIEIRAKASEIKQKAAYERARKEALREAEQAKIDAEIAAAREHLIKTVASIPKVSGQQTLRPAPPSPETYAPGSTIVSYPGGNYVPFLDNDVSIPVLVLDAVAAVAAFTFTLLTFMEI